MGPPVSWTSLHGEVVLGVGVVSMLYAWAWHSHGARPRLGRVTGFALGLLALLGALNGPLHDLSDWYLFSAHMVQHLILTLVVPPLLLAGTPPWMAGSRGLPTISCWNGKTQRHVSPSSST